jgi:putative ABC transport system permease protein
MAQDLLYSVRTLLRAPRFTLVAVLTLGLAIGVNTAIFSLLDVLVLRAVPAKEPDRLVQLSLLTRNGQRARWSFPAFQQLARQSGLSSVIGWSGGVILSVEANGALTRAYTWTTTGNVYSEFPVVPALGRFLVESDVNLDSFTPRPVAVLGYGFWQRQFGGVPNVLGQTIRVEGTAFTVVGVAPQGFRGLARTVEPDVTVPLTAHALIFPGADYAHAGNALWIDVIGRRPPDRSVEQVQAQLNVLAPSVLASTVPASFTGARRESFLALKAVVDRVATPADRYLQTQYTRPLVIVLSIAAIVLLIAGANLAFLVRGRIILRLHEYAVRAALGGSRWRIARQLLCEGLLLAVLGAFAGVLIAWVLSGAIARTMLGNADVPVSLEIVPQMRVLLFALGASVMATALFCALPVWQMSRRVPSLHPAGTYGATASSRSANAVVVMQIALSVVLLTNVTLLVRSFRHLQTIAPGYVTDDVSVAFLEPQPGVAPVTPDVYWRSLLDAVVTRGGAKAAALSRSVPGAAAVPTEPVSAASSAKTMEVSAVVNEITPGYFDMLRIPTIAGRDFTWDDSAGKPAVAIVSRSLASRLFGRTSVVGEQIRIGTAANRQRVEVVGVVENVRHDLKRADVDAVYVSMTQAVSAGPSRSGALLVQQPQRELRSVVQTLGREYVTSLQSLDHVKRRTLMQERVTAMIASLLGVLAVIFVAIGTYGLLSYMVVGRMREYGIRLALGANTRQVIGSIVASGCVLALLGIGLGVVGAVFSTRLVQSLLFGITTSDRVTWVSVPLAILAVAAMASLWPALRAGRVRLADLLKDG